MFTMVAHIKEYYSATKKSQVNQNVLMWKYLLIDYRVKRQGTEQYV